MQEGKPNHYKILGVETDAKPGEIRAAYERLAKIYHPDNNVTGSAEKFKDIKTAYETLIDEKKRNLYDRFSDVSEGLKIEYEEEDFSIETILDAIFGRSESAKDNKNTIHGSDLEYVVRMNVEELHNGKTVNISINTYTICPKCIGNLEYILCKACGGSGIYRTATQWFITDLYCPKCRGAKKIVKNVCICEGGRVKGIKNIQVKIPAGVERIKIAGEGEAGAHLGKHGDLYVSVEMIPHPIFKKRGKDILYEMNIDFISATLGSAITIPCIDKTTRKINIPAGTQSATEVVLEKKGVTTSGDMVLMIMVETPTSLNDEQKELIIKLQNSLLSKNFPLSTRDRELADTQIKKYK